MAEEGFKRKLSEILSAQLDCQIRLVVDEKDSARNLKPNHCMAVKPIRAP
jgi:hypothetical protein